MGIICACCPRQKTIKTNEINDDKTQAMLNDDNTKQLLSIADYGSMNKMQRSPLKNNANLNDNLSREPHHENKGLNMLFVEKYKTKKLESDIHYVFDKIIIDQNATLTVEAWNGRKGGKLFIKSSTDIILNKNAKIDVSSKGYRGGYSNKQGESFHGVRSRSKEANYGGGGCPDFSGIPAGGGYGTDGYKGQYTDFDKKGDIFGGKVYGYPDLRDLYLGSGGGGGFGSGGGHGGGVLKLECRNLILQENAKILSNGGHGQTNMFSGSGSGGSIFIIAHKLLVNTNDAIIEAKGGDYHTHGVVVNEYTFDNSNNINQHVVDKIWNESNIKHMHVHETPFGQGGLGRIRLDISFEKFIQPFFFGYFRLNDTKKTMSNELIRLIFSYYNILNAFNIAPKPFTKYF